MATTTPNYGWPVPTSTDLVKDGATAIEALGDAIDATVFGLPSSGMTLISTTTIGTTVSSVNVTSAFNATYDNYKITISDGVASTTVVLSIKLGATATGYYSAGYYSPYTGASSALQQNNAASWGNNGGAGTADGLFADIDLNSPFLAKRTRIRSSYYDTNGQSSLLGYLNNTTSYTDFTLTPSTGTLTGGTIRVYGYTN
jgi:hypothetical protein